VSSWIEPRSTSNAISQTLIALRKICPPACQTSSMIFRLG